MQTQATLSKHVFNVEAVFNHSAAHGRMAKHAWLHLVLYLWLCTLMRSDPFVYISGECINKFSTSV
jgi:hypothetical protein